MIENCTLYFPLEKLPLKKILPAGKSNEGFFKSATQFEFETQEGVVRLNLQHPNLAHHLQGFCAFVSRLPNPPNAKTQALELIKATKTSVGVILPCPVTENSQTFSSLKLLLQKFGGFMFVKNSIMLPDETFIVGPLADEYPATTVEESDNEQLSHLGDQGQASDQRLASREAIYRKLAMHGFRCNRHLPLLRSDASTTLRPKIEVASRLLALHCLCFWVTFDDAKISSAVLRQYLIDNELIKYFSPEELVVWKLSRNEAGEAHRDTIGWKLENIWALAWLLGFKFTPQFVGGQINNQMITELLQFLPHKFDISVTDFAEKCTLQSLVDVDQMEDLFYCVHNAVRSAQLGSDSVPDGFHPIRDGGAIAERRHALTWALSPGVDWNDTDLST